MIKQLQRTDIESYCEGYTHTLTMGFPKVGHCIEPGKSYSGKTMAIDIGFPKIENQLSGVVWRLDR